MTTYYRPILQMFGPKPAGALALGWCWFDQVEVLARNAAPQIVPARAIPAAALDRLTTPRAQIAGMTLTTPRIMGILNVTPDSFSDGGLFTDPDAACTHALGMVRAGADIIDIGGESTRPGAQTVDHVDEIARTAPVIAAIRASSDTPISIDTRKSQVAAAALHAGATMVNDVSAMTYDPAMAKITAAAGAPICLMHASGDPATMQNDPAYDNVLLDVYDFLAAQISTATVLIATGLSSIPASVLAKPSPIT